ncbi:MAG: DUF2269 family protein [Cypionkella sp.]
MDPYLLAKTLHILSSTVLFGTGMGTAFQMAWVMRHGNSGQAAQTAAGVVMADWVFTTPAGVIQPLTGLWLIQFAGFSLTERWLLAAYGLYAVAFLCWAPVVHLQLRIRDLCRAQAPDAPIPPTARHLYRIWFALGWPAFAALVAIFWLMVTKPDFI